MAGIQSLPAHIAPTVIPAKAGIQCLGMDSGSSLHCARNDGERGGRYPFPASACRLPPSFPRKRESSTSAWIPSLRFTSPGMTGERGDGYPFPASVFQRMANRFTVIPAKAGIQYLGMDSGSPFHFAPKDGEQSGWHPLPVSAFPPPSNPPTVIPAKAGIQYLGVDSGSPFHSARNDGGAEWLASTPYQRITTSGEPSRRHSRESGNPIPRHGFRVSVSLRPE